MSRKFNPVCDLGQMDHSPRSQVPLWRLKERPQEDSGGDKLRCFSGKLGNVSDLGVAFRC